MGLKLNGPLSENFLKIRRIGVGSVILTYPCMAPSLLPALLPLGGHIADRDNITRACPHTVSLDKKDQLEGPLMVLPPGWSAVMWRDQDKPCQDGEFLTGKTNRENKIKCRGRKEGLNSLRT